MLTVPAFLLMKTLSLSSTSGVEPAPVSSSLDTYSGQLPSQQPQNSVEKRGYAPFSSSPFLYTSQFVGFLVFFSWENKEGKSLLATIFQELVSSHYWP